MCNGVNSGDVREEEKGLGHQQRTFQSKRIG